jgi:phenylacetaldehyde dehydrogenase
MNAALISDDLYSKAQEFTRRPRELLIGGRWQPAKSGASFEVVDPSNGRIFAHAAAGDAADIDAAVKAERAALDGP